MRQFLHLLVLDSALNAALTTAHGRRLLPIVAAPETSRIAGFVRRWLSDRQIDGQPVGQWLGRVSFRDAAVDWLVVVQATDASLITVSTDLQWASLETLRASDWHLAYQRWAVERVLAVSEMPSVHGPFGRPTWLRDVCDWIRRVLDESADAKLEVVAHRLSSHEVVLECQMANGRWFFKGLCADRAPEATLTSAMSQLMPASFARTVASETFADGSVWWLMEACPGMPLIDRLTTSSVSLAVETYVSAQQVIARAIAEKQDVPMPNMDLSALAIWSIGMVEDAGDGLNSDVARAAIEHACAEVDVDTPRSWVAADLDPSNVIIDDRNVRFIDLDDAAIGPAPIAVAIFLRRLQRVAPSRVLKSALTMDLVDCYQRAWTPSLRLFRRWHSIGLVSECLECYLAWQRVETKSNRGEVYGAREIARPAIQRRLLRAVTRHRACTPLS